MLHVKGIFIYLFFIYLVIQNKNSKMGKQYIIYKYDTYKFT